MERCCQRWLGILAQESMLIVWGNCQESRTASAGNDLSIVCINNMTVISGKGLGISKVFANVI